MNPKRKLLRQLAAVICAFVAIGVIVFVISNLRNYRREKAGLFEDVAVRWGEDSYIPNLDVGFESTLPEWIVELIPWKYGRIFDRVTYLDNAVGSNASEDLKHCLEFRYVDTIVLGQVTDPEELVEVLARFPRLANVHLDSSRNLGSGNPELKELLELQLPTIRIVEMERTKTKMPKPKMLDAKT